MPFIPSVNTARCVILFNHLSIGCANVIHIKQTGDWSESDLTDTATLVRDWVDHNDHRAVMSSGTSPRRVQARNIAVADGEAVEVECAHIVGTASGAPEPGQVTAVATLRTPFTGRSRRGRIYHVGLSEGMRSSNGLTLGAQGDLEDSYEDLRAQLEAESRNLIVASFYSGIDSEGHPIPRDEALRTDVTDITVDARLDTQRRRLDGQPYA